MRVISGVLLSFFGAMIATGAMAETLTVTGVYAAGEDAAAGVHGLSIDSFGGEAGERLAFAIEDRLRTASVAGVPWFDVSLNAQGTNIVVIVDRDGEVAHEHAAREAVLRGTASLEVTDLAAGTREVKECAERDAKDKCIRREPVIYKCRNRAVMVRPELRLITGDGRTVYALRDHHRAEQRYCADEDGEPSTDDMIEGLIAEIAAQVRFDLVPTERADDVRVLESRKGIARDDRDAFRAAVKLINHDPFAACQAFSGLEANNAQDVSVLFNLGLCQESEGNLGAAEEYYAQVLAISPKEYAVDAMDRIASRYRAQRQMALHYPQ